MAKRAKRAESRARYFVRTQAALRGWNVEHPSRGGDCLEEQEIVGFFPDIGLGLNRPDFLFCLSGQPIMVVETKNELSKIDQAIAEACDYAQQINNAGKYRIPIAVGVAGEDDHGYSVCVRFLKNGAWTALTSNGYEISSLPSKREVDLAVIADDATTTVTVPSASEFIDAAIELSQILRLAKVEAPLRPRVIGSIVLALYQGDPETASDRALDSINQHVNSAIDESVDLVERKKDRLKEALKLQGSDYERLSPYILRIICLLKRLNIRAVLQTDTDFLGLFYEAFLRYGYDNNALGIVFTPRHITRFCVDLIDARVTDKIVDLACGTGGFLVAAFDRMMKTAHGPKAIARVKQSLLGYDTNPTIWALATLNMFFRGDGKTHIENSSCFDTENVPEYTGHSTRAFLNPPFSQEGEPERDFIDASMRALEPEGVLACVVKAGIFADEDNQNWRREFTRQHTVLGVISLPDDLFYPTAAPTSILLARAHIPHPANGKVFMARIWNDGFEKLKGRRVEVPGSQIPETCRLFKEAISGADIHADNAITIESNSILDGVEWSPQQWLPEPPHNDALVIACMKESTQSVFRAIAIQPGLASAAIDEFSTPWSTLEPYPLDTENSVEFFFDVKNGKSTGEKNYREGSSPYISSGDTCNSIIRLIEPEPEEVFTDGGLTVTAFGQAYLQPWPFAARGNGGSAVRVLIPRYRMSVNDLLWFAGQINAQKWRFFYGRMAIKSRLERLRIKSPQTPLADAGAHISQRLRDFAATMAQKSDLS